MSDPNHVPPGTPPPSPPPPQPSPPTGPGRLTPGPAGAVHVPPAVPGSNHPVRSLGEAVVPATSDAPMTDGSPEVPRQGLGTGASSGPLPAGAVEARLAYGSAEPQGAGFSLPQPPPFQIGTARYLAAPSITLSLHRRNR